MIAKEYLKQIQAIHTKIENKKERIERLDGLLTSPAVGELKQDKVQTSIRLDKQESMIAQKQSLEDELQRLMYEEAALIIKIGKQIDGMENPTYSRILHLRYEESCSFEIIADKMNKDIRYIWNLHGLALKAFDDAYTKKV